MLIHMANVLFVERLLYHRATMGQFKQEFKLQAPFLVTHFVCVYRFYMPKGHFGIRFQSCLLRKMGTVKSRAEWGA